MKNFSFEVDVFGDVVSKDSISPEQKTKLSNFFSQNEVNISYCKSKFF